MAAPLRTIIAIILIWLPLAALASGSQPGDDAVLAAHKAFTARDAAALLRAAAATKGHILDVYVNYWILNLRLKEAAPAELDAFLSRNEGTPLAQRLRQEWLHELGKKAEWELFRQQFSLLPQPDRENKCLSFQERLLRTGPDDHLLADFKQFWDTPRPLPEQCLPVVAAIIPSGRLSASEIVRRVRMLLIENLVSEARRTRDHLQTENLPAGGQIEEVFRHPAVFLQQGGEILNTPPGRELSFVALVSLARSNIQEAAHLLDDPLKTILSPREQQQLWAYLALRGARAHLPESLEWFAKGGREALSGEHLAWRTRLALRQGNWLEVKNAISGMTTAMRGETAWTYWLGRSLLMTGNPEDGRKLFSKISGHHDFYGLLAAEELGITLRLPPPAAGPTQQELSQISGLPGIKRALALFRLNLRTYAAREWRWSISAMGDRQLLAAAELARLNGIWDSAANTAAMTKAEHDFSLRYVSPYRDVLLKHARNCNIDEAIVLGLVRQESRFITDARSSAGATGLMQLMPETARLTARTIGMNGFDHSRLTRPEINARLGTSYLRQIMDRFSTNYAFAAAGYNAGPHRAQRWRSKGPLEGAIYVESIPFTETRLYVKQVLANAVYYSALAQDRPLSLKQILGTIAGSAEGPGAVEK